ncbi:hypothetical protein RM572_12745 [Streptomyces sp. DSM 42041]|uniref:Uncharacterized protein n=1 Tax=Streptomyces hazeniae TaxID=3075538 RepID=A0ABU2NRM1_9ACTN|nr:hypothetical protein [Streptomyces sp. DSM 42041]MDT0379634.1 hypothetical protein [Streptomyces sp. DSM 42041]
MRTALRTLEGLLLDGGGRTARRNAWQAVLEDRSRARARAEAERLLTAMPTPGTALRPVAAPRPAIAAAPQAVSQAGAGALQHG